MSFETRKSVAEQPISFDRSKLNGLVSFLREEYLGLTISKLADLSSIPRRRFYRLLSGEIKKIKPSELDSLWHVAKLLENGNIAYTPNHTGRTPAGIKFNLDNFRQFVNFLRERYSLVIKTISDLSDIPVGRLERLLKKDNSLYIHRKEIKSLFNLPDILDNLPDQASNES